MVRKHNTGKTGKFLHKDLGNQDKREVFCRAAQAQKLPLHSLEKLPYYIHVLTVLRYKSSWNAVNLPSPF